MKRLMILSLMFLGIFFIAPVWSHHMAEGIISDDIWQMVDQQLEESNSLHNITIDQVMDSMAVTNDDSGNVVLVTSYMVETSALDEYMEAFDIVLDGFNGISSGSSNRNSGRDSALDIEVDQLDNGMTVITIYEPVGSGESQEVGDADIPSSGKG